MAPAKLTCKETVELVTDYLEAELLPEMEARFKQHVDTCPGCTIYMDQMRQTLQALRRLTDDTTSAEDEGLLLQLFQDWQKTQSPE